MKISITLRLVLWMATTAVVVYSFAVAYDYQLTREHILAKSRLEASRIIDSAVSDLTANLEGIEDSTDLFAQVLSENLPPPDQLQDLLQKIVSARRDLYGAAIAISPGILQPAAFAPYFYHRDNAVVYADLALADYELGQQDWYRLPIEQGKALWTRPYFDEGGGNVLMTTYTVPIIKDTRVLGVVTADMTLDRLHNYLSRIRLGADGFALLLTQDGTVISHPDVKLALKSLTTIYPSVQQPAWQNTLAQAARGERGVVDLPCPHLDDNCLVGFSQLAETGWVLIVLYPKQEMLADLHNHSFKVLLIAVIGVLVLLVAVSLISRRLTLPLVALAKASQQLGGGDLDTPLPAARGEDEVARLINAFTRMRERLKEFIGKLEQETASRHRLQGELDAAHHIQMEMLPDGGNGELHKNEVDVWARLIPAKSVGGDLYTWLDSNPRKLWLVVGDVSDKGVPAALFMARTLTLLQQYATSGLSVSDVLAKLNDNLVEHNDACMFVTLFCAVLHLDSGLLEFSSGGHTAPILRSKRNKQTTVVTQDHGPALGLCESAKFPVNRLQLASGDMLCVYTDGIDEAFNTARQQFGLERLQSALATAANDCAEAGKAVLDAVMKFSDGSPQSDDITLLLVQWHASITTHVLQWRPLLEGKTTTALTALDTLSFAPRLPALADVFSHLATWLQQQGCSDDKLLHDLKLVTEEIFVNIVNYGQLADSATVTLLLARSEESILLEFLDGGLAWNPLEDSATPTLGLATEETAIGGLGVFLVRELTDAQAYRREQGLNRFCVLKYI